MCAVNTLAGNMPAVTTDRDETNIRSAFVALNDVALRRNVIGRHRTAVALDGELLGSF